MLRKRTERGFSALEILAAIAIIALIGLAGYSALKVNRQQSTAQNDKPEATSPKTKPAQQEPAAQGADTTGWKTFKSPLSGYTVKYPADWVDESSSKIFTNNLGGTSNQFYLKSTQRTGSYGGEDANTYLCLTIEETSRQGWHRLPRNAEKTPLNERFSPAPGRELSLALESGKTPMQGSLLVLDGSTHEVKVNDQYQIHAFAFFNCIQGDYRAIEKSSENFASRKEIQTAKEIFKTIRF